VRCCLGVCSQREGRVVSVADEAVVKETAPATRTVRFADLTVTTRGDREEPAELARMYLLSLATACDVSSMTWQQSITKIIAICSYFPLVSARMAEDDFTFSKVCVNQ
jgi:malonyl CoA-acyl carrier protein transacylase